MNKSKHILSCDWGTSSFRLRLVDVDDKVTLKEFTSEDGINAMHNAWINSKQNETERLNFYRKYLRSCIEQMHLDDIKNAPVIISGMASSTIGMKELQYAHVPFDVSGKDLITEIFVADNLCEHDIVLISGLQTANDVMRGEETMLSGCNIENDEQTLIIFPGTHSKHAVVKNKSVVDFKTYMTGEFFQLLSAKSLLAKSVSKNNDWHEAAFINGVKDGATNNILNASFHIRTNQLFQKNSAKENYHYLSGLVIGNELSEVSTFNQKNIMLVCAGNLLQQYITALHVINQNQLTIKTVNANDALVQAHIHLYKNYTKTAL